MSSAASGTTEETADRSTKAPRSSALVAGLFFALLALPFAARWLDFELARRGVALALCLPLAILLRRHGPARLPHGAVVFGLLCLWSLLRCVGTTNPWEGVLQASYFVALGLFLVGGARFDLATLWRALAPTLLLVSAYGIAQSLGWHWPDGYAVSQAVSSLGNRNVASEFTALGLAAWIGLATRDALRGTAPALFGRLCAAAAAFYLGCNGSRSGLIATVIVGGLALVVVLRTRVPRGRALAQLAAVGALALLGWLWQGRGEAAPAAAPAAAKAAAESASDASVARSVAPSTLSVRQSIWASGLEMAGDAPVLGHGTAQFRYEYPRYRSIEEIELSSFGRRFATVVLEPHNDHLRMLVEGGAVGLLLWLAFWFVVGYRQLLDRERLLLFLPGIAFFAIAFVRGPLTNAPAAVLAMAWLGAVGRRSPVDAPAAAGAMPLRIALAVVAAGCATLGAFVLYAQCTHAAVTADRSAGPADRLGAYAAAVAAHGSESRYHSLALRARLAQGIEGAHLDATTEATIQAILEHDPNNPTALFAIAELANRAGKPNLALPILARIFAIDPQHLESTVLGATLRLFGNKDGGAQHAAALLYANPHPRIREPLAKTLGDLATAAEARGRSASATVLRREERFVRALDALLENPRSTRQLDARRDEFPADDDVRMRALFARQLLAFGLEPAAAAFAPESRVELSSGERRLLAPVFAALRPLPRWARVLGDDP